MSHYILNSCQDVQNFLLNQGVDAETVQKLYDENVDAAALLDLNENDLKELEIKLGTRKRIMRVIPMVQCSEHINRASIPGSLILPCSSASSSIPSCSSTQPVVESSLTTLGSIPPSPLTSLGSIPPFQYETSSLPEIVGTYSMTPSSSCTVASAHEVVNPSLCPLSRPSIMPPSPSASSRSGTPPSTSTANSCTSSTPDVLKYEHRTPKKIPEEIVEELSPDPDSEIAFDSIVSTPKYSNSWYNDPNDIDVKKMLTDCSNGAKVLQKIKEKKIVSRSEITAIVRIAVGAMVDDLQNYYPKTEQKLSLAKAMVRDIPLLKIQREGVRGYEHLFCPETREGTIEWRFKSIRANIPQSQKRQQTRKHRAKSKSSSGEVPCKVKMEHLEIDSATQQKINHLKFREISKSDVFQLMHETFESRREFVKNGASVASVLDEYPRFKEYCGELIDAEFRHLYPAADSFMDRFPSLYSEKITKYVNQRMYRLAEKVGFVYNDNLKALLYLADLLPLTGSRKHKQIIADEECKYLSPSENLVIFATEQENSSIVDVINHRGIGRQPYLICTSRKVDKIKQFFLVLDYIAIELGDCPMKAFDLLYKCHYVFDLQYEASLFLFYNFMDHILYRTVPGPARGSVESLNNILLSVEV